MRRTISAAPFVAALLLASMLLPATTSAAQASTTRVRLSDAECATNTKATGKPASQVCWLDVTVDTGSVSALACAVPAGYTHCGQVGVRTASLLFGIPWSVTTNAGYARNASTGKVIWQWVTCDKSAIGFTVTVTWCGSYHSGQPDTDFGANFDVSAVYQGSPITFSHGHRSSINGFTGAQCCTFGW